MFVRMVNDSTKSAQMRLMISGFMRDLNRKGHTYAAIGDMFGVSEMMICHCINYPTKVRRKNITTTISWYRFVDTLETMGYDVTINITRKGDEDSD